MNQLILASSSPYRRTLLARLGVPFVSRAPEVDESSIPGESTKDQTVRLAQAKAEHVALTFPDAYVIGSDQLAEFAGKRIGKPGSVEHAIEQLFQFSGRNVIFYTSVAVVCKNDNFLQISTVETEVSFRTLDEEEIRSYVALDQPLDCAGAFRSEAAGPVLLQAMHSSDPTAIVGLPLIALSAMLRRAGFKLP